MKVNFKQRSYEEELMDDLQSSGEVIEQTLKELEIINRLLGGNYITLRGIEKKLKDEVKNGEPISIVDLGCGGGDMLVLIAKWARKKGISLKLIGVDANPHIVAYAQAHTQDYPEISYLSLDIFSSEFQEESYDLFITSLFTHHFEEERLVELFRLIKQQSRLGFINNDLHRHWLAFYSIKWLTRLFSKSKMVQNDAPLSVLRGFKRKELREILKKANIDDFSLRWMWAFRWQLLF